MLDRVFLPKIASTSCNVLCDWIVPAANPAVDSGQASLELSPTLIKQSWCLLISVQGCRLLRNSYIAISTLTVLIIFALQQQCFLLETTCLAKKQSIYNPVQGKTAKVLLALNTFLIFPNNTIFF